ncbi:MAG: glycosyltransferase [Acutalibacteraceae bacterium]|nr:glycosyltransferase [Acutalibacteraceae bacterium]
MKIAFLTNFLTHHQVPFCEIMYKKLGKDFHLIVMRSADEEQRKLGYKELNDLYPFVIKTYENELFANEAMHICEEADIVIWGSAPEKYVKKRLEQNKLTFVYTERIFKKSILYAFYPPMLRHMYKKFTRQRNKNQYYLCAGGYVSRDINMFTHTSNKFFKWGYFPETKMYEDVDALIESKKPNSIIWVARYIDWKHPEIPVEIARRLKKDGYDFKINMIGNGIMLDEITEIVKKNQLTDYINILGGISSDNVRSYMEKSEIHIFTSDRNEGWGAVLNESMNSACAVVANKKIGSAPFLVNNGENGFTYKNINELYKKVKYLLDNDEERKKISKTAYKTMTEEWNAEIATQRFLDLCNGLLENKCVEYRSGPCSMVDII